MVLNITLSPLGKNHCTIFKFISIFSLIIAFFVFIGVLTQLKDFKFKMITAIMAPLFIYYMQRIFYSMCINSLE